GVATAVYRYTPALLATTVDVSMTELDPGGDPPSGFNLLYDTVILGVGAFGSTAAFCDRGTPRSVGDSWVTTARLVQVQWNDVETSTTDGIGVGTDDTQ